MMISLRRAGRGLSNSLAVAALLSVSSPALAELELSDQQKSALIDFYEATEGDQWDFSDHWLDESVGACDWYGVACFEGHDGVEVHLALSNNGLTGTLPESLGDMPGLQVLVLANNALSGPLDLHDGQYADLMQLMVQGNQFESLAIGPEAAPGLVFLAASDNMMESLDISPDAASNLHTVELSNNLLSGPVPDFLEGRSSLATLDLSHNLLDGDLPEWLGELQLEELYLGGNDLSGSIAPALEALAGNLEYDPTGDPDRQLLLDLRDNQFSGELDDWLADHARGFPNWLNLCWNDLEVTSTDAEAMLAEEHLDGAFDFCLGRSVEPPQMTHSGSWFDPERSGEGISMMLLDNGETLIHWFTHAPQDHLTDGQAWFSGNREQVLPGFDMIHLYAPIGGGFAQGLPDPDDYQIGMGARVDVLDIEGGGLHARQYVNMFSANGGSESQIREYTRITQLAGTTCDNQSAFQQYSGAWYDPERDGEGFVIEVLPDDRVLVYWFTYAADDSGDQSWVLGDGEFIDDGIIITPPPGTPEAVAVIEDVHLPIGSFFGEDFDPDAIELLPWGQIELAFLNDDEAVIAWESDLDDFSGSGEHELQRLARPQLAECD